MGQKAERSKTWSGYRSEDKAGSVLILALFALCLLTVFTVKMALVTRQKLSVVRRLERSDRLRNATEAGVTAAMAVIDSEMSTDMLEREFEYRKGAFVPRSDETGAGFIYSYSDDICAVEVRITDEAGRVNLNSADMEMLKAVLEIGGGMDESQALELACCIIDWRDSDGEYAHAQYGAEDKDYKGLPEPYEAKDARFEILDELQLVMGVDDELYGVLEDLFTVSGAGRINLNSASKNILIASGLAETTVEKILSFRLGRDGLPGTDDDNHFEKLSGVVKDLDEYSVLTGIEKDMLQHLVKAQRFTTGTSSYRICGAGESKLEEEDMHRIMCIVRNDGKTVFWRESP